MTLLKSDIWKLPLVSYFHLHGPKEVKESFFSTFSHVSLHLLWCDLKLLHVNNLFLMCATSIYCYRVSRLNIFDGRNVTGTFLILFDSGFSGAKLLVGSCFLFLIK